jgi:hypothetical protein
VIIVISLLIDVVNESAFDFLNISNMGLHVGLDAVVLVGSVIEVLVFWGGDVPLHWGFVEGDRSRGVGLGNWRLGVDHWSGFVVDWGLSVGLGNRSLGVSDRGGVLHWGFSVGDGSLCVGNRGSVSHRSLGVSGRSGVSYRSLSVGCRSLGVSYRSLSVGCRSLGVSDRSLGEIGWGGVG